MEQLSNYSCKVLNQGNNIYELLSASFQGVKRLFVLAYAIAADAENNEAGTKEEVESIFFQKETLKFITYWLMEEIFIIKPTI